MYNEANRIVSDWEFFLKTVIINNVEARKINCTIAVMHNAGISRMAENTAILQQEVEATLHRYFPDSVIELISMHEELKRKLNSTRVLQIKVLSSKIRRAVKNLLN
jgi:hypothetical protein